MEKTQTETETKKEVRIAILTPYLTEDLNKRGCDPDYVQIQAEKFGYDINNFSETNSLRTLGHIVRLETDERHTSPKITDNAFAIAGSTRPGESQVSGFMGSGLIVARYSVFYGDKCDYSGKFPEESGYSLDIPKKVSIVKTLITDDDFLDAVVLREEEAIRAAIGSINKRIEMPILITSYLQTALRHQK